MRYTDLEFLAQEPSIIKEDGKKLLRFTLTVVGVLESVKCELDLKEIRRLKEAATTTEATWKEARELGAALGAALLSPKVFNVLNDRINMASAGKEGLRIRLIFSGSELNNLPWEFLLFNRGGGEETLSDFLCLMPNVSVVRHPANVLPAWRLEATLPVKVMIAAASPEKWPPLKVAQEVGLIRKALEKNAQVDFSTSEHAQGKDLPDRTNPAHIFHFAGHGKFELKQSAVPGAYEGKSSVILENEFGEEEVLDADLLAVRLRDAGVRVAVLGACQTAQRDDVNTWSSVAEALAKAELGAVVGMQFPMVDASAIAFAESFYGALAIGLTIDEAVTAGRVAVSSLNDARGWANAALYLRAPDGVIFPAIANDSNLETARQQAVVNISQRFEIVSGLVKGAYIESIDPGATVNIEQTVGEVSGELHGPTILRVGGR